MFSRLALLFFIFTISSSNWLSQLTPRPFDTYVAYRSTVPHLHSRSSNLHSELILPSLGRRYDRPKPPGQGQKSGASVVRSQGIRHFYSSSVSLFFAYSFRFIGILLDFSRLRLGSSCPIHVSLISVVLVQLVGLSAALLFVFYSSPGSAIYEWCFFVYRDKTFAFHLIPPSQVNTTV